LELIGQSRGKTVRERWTREERKKMRLEKRGVKFKEEEGRMVQKQEGERRKGGGKPRLKRV
jgi:hypothetical protein